MPSILTRLVLTYATSFYASGLWNLLSKECEKLYTSWNVTIRQIFNISRRSRRYLIEPVSLCQHLKTSLAARFVTFVDSLINSNKFSVRFLARLCQADKRTVVGKTMGMLLDTCGLDESMANDLTASHIKRCLKYSNISIGEEWRVCLVRELIDVRDGQFDVQGFSKGEIETLLETVCES